MLKIPNKFASPLIILLLISVSAVAGEKLNVVTTLTDFADIAKQIGGDKVEAFAIAKGYQDPHFVDPKPSYIIKLQKADLFVHGGMDLESGWVPPLLEGARNANILPGAKGHVDASKGVHLLEVPSGDPAQLRAQGDIHIYGNPHYWLDPVRGKQIAENICAALSRLQPQNEAYFKSNLEAFTKKIDAKVAEWQALMQPYNGVKIVAFHNSWPYFDERFGFDIVAFIEPKPGIPPTPKHLAAVIDQMNQIGVKVIIVEPYYSKDPCNLVASKTGAKVLELATAVDGAPEVKSYLDVFDYNLKKLIAAFQQIAEAGNNGK
ncbi:MAG: metal ABC transporter substrate-binding protein [candidate division KSB1 bacterium]|nr:metal ABC transporter substrate-binding protein [candidate division KSB1 bacterium]MDZ7365001.1 metal ABC transporter substrate-binding protein [candidate division KSB1 bacterium]MDZ7403396.1 metal ABC transporter substrate-binding protein [candidate division KSB1 bacterium]